MTGLNSLVSLHVTVLTAGVPLWVLAHDRIPRAAIAWTLVLNTIVVVLFQVRATRGIESAADGGRALRRSGVLLAVCCCGLAGTGAVPTVAAVALLLGAVAFQAFAEMYQQAGAWAISYDLAPEDRRQVYLAFFGLGNAARNTYGPLVITFLVVQRGAVGWLLLGGSCWVPAPGPRGSAGWWPLPLLCRLPLCPTSKEELVANAPEQSVIVVGAGPTGLALACELAAAGVSCTVLERRLAASTQSRAMGLYSRTMEVLDLRGHADALVALGRPVSRMVPARGARVDFAELDTRFPYLNVIPQSRTEQVLQQRALDLGVTIERGTEVFGLTQDGSGVTLQVRAGAGSGRRAPTSSSAATVPTASYANSRASPSAAVRMTSRRSSPMCGCGSRRRTMC